MMVYFKDKNGGKMRKVEILLLIVLFLSGCATFKTKEPQKSFEEIINMKLNQAISIAETSLEISKNAEKKSIEALNTSNEAKANSEEAIKKVNEAIDAVNETREFTQKEVQRAIDQANKAKDEAIKFADESSKKAIDAANEAIKVAKETSNEAIRVANQSSERSIGVANQVLAELNRLRATIQIKEEEPIVEEEPKSGKYYTIKKGDTLKKIAYKFYNDTSKWKLIYEVNKKVIKNPNALTPGTKIYIP